MAAFKIRALRDRLGIGLHEADRILTGRRLRDQVESAETVDDLKPVLLEVLTKLYPDPEA